MMFPTGRLLERTLSELRGVDPRLVFFAGQTSIITGDRQLDELTPVVICGVRTQAQQNSLRQQGVSWTNNSRHITGRAIDIALFRPDGSVTWAPHFYAKWGECLRPIFQSCGIRWGGDWKVRDFVHFELS